MNAIGGPRSDAGPEGDSRVVAIMDRLAGADTDRLLRVFVRRRGDSALSEWLYGELEEEARQDPEGMAALLGLAARGEE